jgi:DNA-binding response OmpR family regulator
MSESKPSVLIVEDDPSIAQLYALKLRMDGFRVDIATDAATAAVMFDRGKPDVICVDSRLPDAPGSTVVERMAARGARVIMLTNDQEAYENSPKGVRALLKWKTTPAELSDELAAMVAAELRR